MQADPTIHGPAHIRFAPLGMLDERSPFDAHREGPSIGTTPAALAWLKPMQLPMMPVERRKAYQSPIIRGRTSSYSTISQHPGIDTVRLPHLSQLLAGLLEAQLLTQRFRLIPLHQLERCELPDLLVEPVFADFQRRETAIPSSFPLFRGRGNILNHKKADWKDLAQERCQS